MYIVIISIRFQLFVHMKLIIMKYEFVFTFDRSQTALHWAAKFNKPDIIKLIAGTHGISPNVRTVRIVVLLFNSTSLFTLFLLLFITRSRMEGTLRCIWPPCSTIVKLSNCSLKVTERTKRFETTPDDFRSKYFGRTARLNEKKHWSLRTVRSRLTNIPDRFWPEPPVYVKRIDSCSKGYPPNIEP